MRYYFEISPNYYISVVGWDYSACLYRLNTFFHADLSHLKCLDETEFKKHKELKAVLNI